MNSTIEIILRSILSFSVLLLFTRLMGKKQLGQLNIFTYITGIAIGDMASQIAVQRKLPVTEGIIGIVVWSLLVILVEFISLKSMKTRDILNGVPTIVIRKGKILEKELRKLRLNIDDLTMLLRTNKVFSILDVDYAILEPNGDLSVLKKAEKENLIREDFGIKVKEQNNLPIEIIVDGKVLYKNLIDAGYSREWLEEQLEKYDTESKDILYSEIQNGNIYVQKKNKQP